MTKVLRHDTHSASSARVSPETGQVSSPRFAERAKVPGDRICERIAGGIVEHNEPALLAFRQVELHVGSDHRRVGVADAVHE